MCGNAKGHGEPRAGVQRRLSDGRRGGGIALTEQLDPSVDFGTFR